MTFKSIGTTGARSGATGAQATRAIEVLSELCARGAVEGHSGDCVGWDLAFAEWARGAGLSVIGHPPTDSAHRTFWPHYTRELAPRPFLKRNRDIVHGADVLVACPPTETEITRSGAWATIRYARKKSLPVAIVLPSGNLVLERWPEAGEAYADTL